MSWIIFFIICYIAEFLSVVIFCYIAEFLSVVIFSHLHDYGKTNFTLFFKYFKSYIKNATYLEFIILFFGLILNAAWLIILCVAIIALLCVMFLSYIDNHRIKIRKFLESKPFGDKNE